MQRDVLGSFRGPNHNFQKIVVVNELIVAQETLGGALPAGMGYTMCGHCHCC